MMYTPRLRLLLRGEEVRASITRVEYAATLGEPFRLLVDLALLDSSSDLPVATGEELILECDDEPFLRQIRGIVANVDERLERHLHDQLTVVPALWIAGLRIHRRIFHDATAIEAANQVVQGYTTALAAFQDSVVGVLKKHDYRVQTNESDLALIARLFADDGLTHFYDHAANRWVVTDDTTSLQASALTVPFIEAHGLDDAGGDHRRPHVHAISVARPTVETAVALRDYDFRRPTLCLDATRGNGDIEMYLPGRGDFGSAEEGGLRATRLLQSFQAPQKVFRLRTNFLVAPGSTLKVEGAPRDDANTTLLVASSQARMNADGVGGDLLCIEAAKPWRPRLRPKPRVEGIDTALVVGAPGQALDVDAFGRILVQFHWDRQKQPSCRARVSQALSGSAFGSQFIPRIGMEVLVSYIGGDPEQPVVTGCVYNGENPTPFLLPADATKSGVRTQTIPGGKRSQEIVFEDKANAEVLRIAAARDLDEVVPGAKSVTIGGGLTSSVGGGETATVAGDSTRIIAGSSVLKTELSLAESADGSSTTTIAGNRTVTVGCDRSTSVSGTDTMTIGKPKKEGAAAWTVHGVFSLSVDGEAGEIGLSAAKCLRLRCVDSEILLTPDEVKISGKAITLNGKESVVATGKGPCLTLANDASVTTKAFEIITPQSWLRLDEKVHVVGTQVLLNSEPLPNAQPPNDDGSKPKNFKIVLLDLSHKPYDSIPYTLTVDGESFEGETDESGTVAHDVNPMARSATVTLWVDGTPGKGRSRKWQMPLADLPPADTPEGLRRRLTSLGYLGGGKTDQNAIEAFQKDFGLPPTGKADDATRAKVCEAFGA